MMAKEKKLLIVSALVFVLLLVAYLAVVRPLVMTEDPGEVTEPLETLEGEDVSEQGRYLMYPQVVRADMQSIFVENTHGSYTFTRDKDGNFWIEGYEGTPYRAESFSELVTAVGYTLSKMKVTDNATDAQLKEYGLSEPQARFTVTTKEGEQHTVYVGYDLLTGGGYYCMPEGRRSIYVLSESLEKTVLAPIEDLVTPVLLGNIGSDDYYTADNFAVFHGKELICLIGVSDREDFQNPQAMHENYMIYPEGYFPNSDMLLDILYYFSEDLMGDRVVKLGPTEEDLAAFGLLDPARTIRFEYKGEEIYLFFSEKQEDGTYYALSSMFPTLLLSVPAEGLEYLEYPLVYWVQAYPFQYWITMVESIDLRGAGADVKFSLTHGVVGTGEEARATLRVDTDTGKVIPDSDVYNFRQFYKTLMSVEIKDYAPLTEAEIADLVKEENCLLTVTVRQLNGKETVYGFYPYSSTGRRALVTVNGHGEFYVMTDIIEKIAGDAVKVLNDLDVDSYGKN